MSDVQSNTYTHHTLINQPNNDINLPTSKENNTLFTSSLDMHPNDSDISSSQKLTSNQIEINPQNPTQWDLITTLQWMLQNDLADLVDFIRDNKIFGQNFLELNHKTLRALDMTSYRDRTRLLRAIKILTPDSDNNGLLVETRKLDFDTPNSPVTPSSIQHSTWLPETSQNTAYSPSESKPSRLSPNTSSSTLASDSLLDQNRSYNAGYNENINSSGPTLSEAFNNISNNRESHYGSTDQESPTPKALSSRPNIQINETPRSPRSPRSPDSDSNLSFTIINPPRFINSIYGKNSSACLSEPSLPALVSPESELSDSIHNPPSQLNSISFDSSPAHKPSLNPLTSGPIITPRKESMANLNRSRISNPSFATSPRPLRNSPSSNLLQPTSLDAMLSSQRRSSLYYTAQRSSMIDGDIGPGKVVESVSTAPTPVSKPKLKSKPSQESGLLASIFPSIFRRTPKHSRKLSCPEDDVPIPNILVHLHDIDGTLYRIYLTPPVTPNHLYDTIAAKLHLDPSKTYYFSATTDSMTTTVSSKRDIVALLYQCNNQTPLKLTLLPQEPVQKPPLPKLQIFSPPIVPNSDKSSFSIASRTPQRPSSTKSPTSTQSLSSITPKNSSEVIAEPVSEQDKTPTWAQMWIERPSTEVISDNLDQYFPDQDLDKPILDPVPETPASPSSPSIASAVPKKIFNESSLGRKKSIRMVVQEAHQRRTSSAKNLSRSNTKLWGSKLTRVNTKKEAPLERPPTVILESPTSVPSPLSDFPLDLIEKQQNQGPPMQWVMGKIIGRGSFGRVFHALNAANGEMIAVKVIELPNPKNQNNISRKRGDLIRDLYSEIELLKDLEHDNIVQYLGFELCPQSINIFLEYVDGGSIESALHRFGPFPEEYCKNMTRQVLKGLEYLHNKDILHRDIKGANVLINSQGICKISDFGISKKNDYQLPYKNNSRMSFKGSVFWMAPEVVRHNGYSAKVDIWSLGCLLIEMLTGQRPWRDLSELATVYRLGQSSAASTPTIPNGTDIAQDFMKQCFILEPDLRPTAKQLLSHAFCK